jgi:ABC-2 type transport system ATP-binding protein
MNAITTRDVHKSYGTSHALCGVDLDVPTGTVAAVLGPNGAGKTTLVEILEGHRSRTSGSVQVLGRDPADRRDFAVLRTQIGVVMQQTMLEPGVSVRDLVRRQASYYADPLDVDAVLTDVELTEKRDALVRSLSGGTRRRLDIALALVGRPAVLFLDEPTAGLDPLSRRNVRALVRRLNQDGTTVVLTSHDLDEVQELADHVSVLDGGRIVTAGSPTQIIRASAAPTHVEFARPLGVDLAGLPAGAQVDDEVVAYETTDDDELTRALRLWSDQQGVPLHRLAIIPPRLDDAYAALLGAGPRNGDPS